MNRRLWRRAMALTLVTAMTAGLAACGGGSGSNGGGSTSSKGEQHYFKATYLSDLPENFNDNVNKVTFKGDVMYYGGYDDNYDSYGIYSYNIVSKETATLYTQGEEKNSNDGSYSSVSDFAVGEDGSVYLMLYNSVVDESSLGDKYDNATLDDVLQFLQDEWGYSEEDAQSTWDDAYAGTYTDENGNLAGIDVEFAREAFHRMGYKPVFVNIDWENKKNLVEQGKIDCIWACFSVTGRENDYHWAGPYMLSRQVIAVNDSSKINKLSDLKNKIIAVQSTTKPEELFLKQTDPKIPKVKQVYSMENRELIYTSLSRGYVDAIAAHEISIRQYMSDFEAKYRILDEDILETGIGVAFAKNDKRGIEKELSKTLKAMVKDGSAKKILQKYVPDAEKYLEVNSLER